MDRVVIGSDYPFGSCAVTGAALSARASATMTARRIRVIGLSPSAAGGVGTLYTNARTTRGTNGAFRWDRSADTETRRRRGTGPSPPRPVRDGGYFFWPPYGERASDIPANRNYDALRRRLPSTIAALRARPARRARLSGEPRKRSRNSASVIATSASGGGGGVAGAVCRAGGA